MGTLAFVLMLILISILIILAYHILDKFGLKLMFILTTIISLILSFKIGVVFSFDVSVNIAVYMAIFALYYIVIEKYKKEDEKDALFLIIETLGFTAVMLIILTMYIPSITDSVGVDIKDTFNVSHIIYYIFILPNSLLITNRIYNIIKKYTDILFINITITTLIVSLVESFVYVVLIYNKVLGLDELIRLSLANYLLKIVSMIVLLPTIKYVIKNKKVVS